MRGRGRDRGKGWSHLESSVFSDGQSNFVTEGNLNDVRIDISQNVERHQNKIDVDPIGVVGGLNLWWNSNMSVQILSSSQFLINTMISFSSGSTQIKVPYFYGPPHQVDKASFWASVMNMGRSICGPWMVV